MIKKMLNGGVAVIEKNKPLGGQWRHPGGSFDKGEEPQLGVVREIKEETGLDIEVIDNKPFHVEKVDYKRDILAFTEQSL